MAKTRSELEAMSKSELLRYAVNQHISIPISYRKPEIVDAIFAWEVAEAEPVAGKLTSEADEGEKPDYVVEHEKKTAELEKLVALAAVAMIREAAKAKSAKKQFENLSEKFDEHLRSEPVPTLFDNVDRKCRECGGEPSDDKPFVADDLCQLCADKLGKDVAM
jgi:hypothetical protein